MTSRLYQGACTVLFKYPLLLIVVKLTCPISWSRCGRASRIWFGDKEEVYTIEKCARAGAGRVIAHLRMMQAVDDVACE